MHLPRDTLTQADRLRKVLNHEEPDRVPCFLMDMDRAGKFWQEFIRREPELMDAYTEEESNILLTPCGDFTIPAFFGADIIVKGCHTEISASKWIDLAGEHNHPEITYRDTPQMQAGKVTGFQITYFGSIYKYKLLATGESYGWYWAPYLRTPEMLVKWFDDKCWPDQLPLKGFGGDIVATNKQFNKSLHILPSYEPSTFTHLLQMLGIDRILYFSRKSPEVLQKIINSFTELHLRQVKCMRTLHPLAAFTYDDLGQKDRPLLSPALFRKFFAPGRKQVNDAIHELGAKSILHSCGNATELLPDLVAAGFDGWQTLEPASGIDHQRVKQQFGDKLSFWGAIDNNVLCFGTPAEVEVKVREKLKIMSPRGGYLVGPAHDYLNTKVDNALALRDAVIRYGYYPHPGE